MSKATLSILSPSWLPLQTHILSRHTRPLDINLAKIIQVALLFPRYVDQEAGMELTKEITIGELEATIKGFKKDKSLGPDGWAIEFYSNFFDTL